MIKVHQIFALITLALFWNSSPVFRPAPQAGQNQTMRKTSEALMKSATSRVKPKLPPIAKAARAGGEVIISVQVDEKGDVTNLRFVSGHPLLREASLAAAKEWRFAPEVNQGGPARVEGEIKFNFDNKSEFEEFVSEERNEEPREVQPQLTSQQQANLKRAEAKADLFIQRWHQTLDLGPLFEEMYVTAAELRQRNIYLFFVLYQCGAGLGFIPGWQEDVDENLRKRAFITMLNLRYIDWEYSFSFTRRRAQQPASLFKRARFRELFREVKLDDPNEGLLTRSEVEGFITKAEQMVVIHRRSLSPGVLKTQLYKSNLRKFFPDGASSRMTLGAANYGLDKRTEVYEVKRGPFVFYLINEADEVKVLTLGFEC
jgi:TonB family protein